MTYSPARAIAGAVLVAAVVAGCGGSGRAADTPTTAPSAPDRPAGTVSGATPRAPAGGTPDPLTPVLTPTPTVAGPSPSPPPAFAAPRGSVPDRLVGEWDGDGTALRFDRIRFAGDGGVRLLYANGLVLEGTAVAEGTSLTLYVPGGPIAYAYWSVEEFDAGYGYTFENLLLDGVSYVRQTSGG
ncbi:hypothetical protein ACFV28_21880 [Streptomyces sp. NPDC059720]|uniref:hypothetical protein n=1 Tax=Streptomyces sp. NPDC059720 TaxID=3346924 RepID=UPI0036802135